MIKRLLIIIPLVVGLTLVSIFIPARQVSIEGIGRLSFETTVTFSVGQEIAYAAAPAGEWWNTDYQYRKKITVSSSGSTAVPDEYSVSFTEDTASLILAGKLRSDGNDWRIAYWDGSSWVELDRHVRSGWDSANTETWFQTQAALSGGGSDDNYYVYYGYSAETGTPPSYWSDSMGADAPSEVYWYADDFEEHASSEDPDGWTDQGTENFYVALHGSEKWFQVNTWNAWERGSTASSMANIGDAVWSATVYYHQSGTNCWGGIGVHIDNGNIGRIVVIRDGGWYQADEPDWANPYGGGWQTNTNIHFPLGTKGRIELITNGTSLDAYWYNPPGYSPAKVTVFTGFTIPSGTGKLDVHVERPGGGNTRWIDADDIIVRQYVSPEPTTSLGSEEYVNISNSPDNFDFGVVAASSTPNTTTGYFDVTNDSTVNITVTIVCNGWIDTTDGTSPWIYGSPAADTAQLKASDGDGAYDVTVDDTTPATLHTTSAPGDDFSWELQLDAPTSFTHGHSQRTTVTLTATTA